MVPDLAEKNCHNNQGGEFSHVHEKFFLVPYLTKYNLKLPYTCTQSSALSVNRVNG
jgi:hypothetical protein